MNKNKGIAKAAKERRRADAEERNARTRKEHTARYRREELGVQRPARAGRELQPGDQVDAITRPDGTRVVTAPVSGWYQTNGAGLTFLGSTAVAAKPPRGVAKPVGTDPVGIPWAPGVTHDHLDEARRRRRRLAAYLRRTAPAVAPKMRTSDVAPPRLGDGLKPNHSARAVSLADAFPIEPELEPIRTDGHVTGHRVVTP